MSHRAQRDSATPPSLMDKNSLFTPRHELFSLDAGALREDCSHPIRRVVSSEILPLSASLALVSGKRPALVQSSTCSTCAPAQSLSFIVNFGQWRGNRDRHCPSFYPSPSTTFTGSDMVFHLLFEKGRMGQKKDTFTRLLA